MSHDHLAQKYLADCPQPVQDYVVKLVNDEREACAAQLDQAAAVARQAQVGAAAGDPAVMLRAGVMVETLTDAAAMVRGGA